MAITKEQKDFIEQVGALAAADMKQSGVLASLTIAQAILESGWGKSGLTVKANALFGIKAGSSWKGKVYSAQTQECYDGATYTTITALFRAYNSWAESVADHSALLTGAARYKAVIGERDYKAACRAIKAAGYATDPQYAEKLIQIIESYSLTAYDGAGTATQPAGRPETSGGTNNTGGAESPADGKGTGTMTAKEKQNRENIVAIAASFYGCKESDGSHKKIIDIYNADKPLARGYPMKYTDAWCACFVSVVSIQGGATAVMPKEVGCGKMIELYQKLGRWQENDAYVPAPGDVIFYDWNDGANYATTDNTAAPDHVGIVVSVTGSTIKVIEGNMSNAVGYRNLAVNGRYIRGFGLPDFSAITVKAPAGTATQPAGRPETSGGSSDTSAALAFAVGDVVRFTGATHYSNANAASGPACKPGTAKVTAIAKGTKHPYHLIAQNGGGSTVYGWVDTADVQPVGGTSGGSGTAAKMRVGARVQYSGPLYRDSNGNGQGMTVSGTYTVKYYYPGRKCGVHIDGLGWVPESACSVIG
ncbi:glucosaminidase domain-containing protein [Acutalibacter muris]|uniref:glucosaminidase domain-containing protein n=1 Tax=Acutalibacter muris TaxID=1796620 RepID=UPI0020CE97BF|nr:glucosaminidase domain-containing protein [Acutalibacter muris]